MQDADPVVREVAIEVFGSYEGADRAQGVAALQALVEDPVPAVREAALEKLRELEELPVPGGRATLEDALHSEQVIARAAAVRAFRFLGSRLQPEDLDALKLALRDSDFGVRSAAALTLAETREHSFGDDAALRAVLAEGDVYLRRAACVALGMTLSSDDDEATRTEHLNVAALEAALMTDEDGEVRVQAANSLRVLGPMSEEAMASVRSVVRTGDLCARKAGIGFFALVPESIGPAELGVIREAMQDPDFEVQMSACLCLGQLGMKVWPGGLEGVRAALSSKDVFERRAASVALASQAPQEEWVDLLDQGVKDDDPWVRWTISRMVGMPAIHIWKGGRKGMRAATQHSDPFIRRAATASLGSSDDGTFHAQDRNLLLQALQHEDFATRFFAIEALGKMGMAMDADCARALVGMLQDDNPTVSHAAKDVIAALSSSAASGAAER